MRSLNRGGVTLVELMVVVVIAAILAALVTTVVLAAGRSARRQSEALHQLRSAAAIAAWWRAALRDSDSADVQVVAPDRLLSPLPVGAGPACAVIGADIIVPLHSWRAQRDPEAGRDLLWLLTDPVAGSWSSTTLLAVGTSSCPDGSAALRLTLAGAAPEAVLVRAVEPLLLRSYLSGASWWLGLAPADGSAVVQPFAGPVSPAATRFAMDSSGVHAFVQPAGGRLREYLGPLP